MIGSTIQVLSAKTWLVTSSVTRKKSPNVYKSCPKMISLAKIIDFDTFTKIA